jgi:selenocysteine lyase/cysteine desulfurase
MSDITSYIANADAFPILRHWDFFNHAGVSPLPRVAADALNRFAMEVAGDAYLGAHWHDDIERLRITVAGLMNAHRDEIAFIKNTSEGLSIVANGIDWRPGDRIVTTAVEYPANIYPWMAAAKRYQAELVMVPEQKDAAGRAIVPLEDILKEAAHPRTRLVTLSHVEFASGQRLDLARIGAFCRQNGKLLCVDGIQSLGVMPVDVQAMNIDYLSADGHKWLLGPEGAGVFYCRRELLEKTRPLVVGWLNVVNAMDFANYDYRLKPDACRFESGSHNVAGLLALKASVDLISSIGVPAITARLKHLGDHLAPRLAQKGYTVISPRDGDQFSGSVVFASSTHDQEAIVKRFRSDHRIEIAFRVGRLRCSPHFYNTEQQMERLAELLPGHG